MNSGYVAVIVGLLAPSNEYSAGPKNFASHNLTDDGAAKSQAASNSVAKESLYASYE